MSDMRFEDSRVQRGTIGVAVVVAVGLLAGFHSVVAGAVDRASEKRLAAQQQHDDTAARASRNALAVQAMPNAVLAGAAYAPRTVSYRSTR